MLERSLNGRQMVPTTLVSAHKIGNKIGYTGVGLAIYRGSRRCFSVGLAVRSVGDVRVSKNGVLRMLTFGSTGYKLVSFSGNESIVIQGL